VHKGEREEGSMMKLLRVLVIDLTCGILNCQVRSSIIKDVIRQFQIRQLEDIDSVRDSQTEDLLPGVGTEPSHLGTHSRMF